MSEQESKPSSGLFEKIIVTIFIVISILVFVWAAVIPYLLHRNETSPANKCINNLRQIDAAKNQWALEHNAKSNNIVTMNDIRLYIELERNNRFIKLDAKGNLPKCPSGGTYTIGKIGDPPTCSLSTTITPAHVLQ